MGEAEAQPAAGGTPFEDRPPWECESVPSRRVALRGRRGEGTGGSLRDRAEQHRGTRPRGVGRCAHRPAARTATASADSLPVRRGDTHDVLRRRGVGSSGAVLRPEAVQAVGPERRGVRALHRPARPSRRAVWLGPSRGPQVMAPYLPRESWPFLGGWLPYGHPGRDDPAYDPHRPPPAAPAPSPPAAPAGPPSRRPTWPPWAPPPRHIRDRLENQ